MSPAITSLLPPWSLKPRGTARIHHSEIFLTAPGSAPGPHSPQPAFDPWLHLGTHRGLSPRVPAEVCPARVRTYSTTLLTTWVNRAHADGKHLGDQSQGSDRPRGAPRVGEVRGNGTWGGGSARVTYSTGRPGIVSARCQVAGRGMQDSRRGAAGTVRAGHQLLSQNEFCSALIFVEIHQTVHIKSISLYIYFNNMN